MIIVKLMGGLGNQLFQYAFGLMLANRFKQKIYLDILWFGYYADRKLNLKEVKPALKLRKTDIFFITLEKVFIWSAAHCRFIRSLNLVSHLKNIQEYLHAFEEKWIYKKIEEPDFDLDKLSNSKNYYFEGYWQNPVYFEDIRPIILKNIKFPELQNTQDLSLQNQILTSESIAIHIRRGDYVNNAKVNQRLGTCSIEYYKQTTNLVLSKIPNAKFFLFTDDPDFVKANFDFLSGATLVSNGTKSEIDELNLMHLCKHFIIANSSFSWWAAWLSQNPNKIVVAPKQWFKNEEANEKCKIVPKDWIKI